MSTHSTIAKLDNDGIFRAVYCHSDGYLEHNGKVLNEYYTDEDKVSDLIKQGDISVLNKIIGRKLPFNDYMLFHENEQSRFYHRDRGEELRISEFDNLDDYIEFGKSYGEHIYLFVQNAWYYFDASDKKEFVELDEVLLRASF